MKFLTKKMSQKYFRLLHPQKGQKWHQQNHFQKWRPSDVTLCRVSLRVIVCLRSGAERLLRCRRTAVPKISCKWLTFITRYVFICTYQKLKNILHLIKHCKLQRFHWSFIVNYKMINETWHLWRLWYFNMSSMETFSAME